MFRTLAILIFCVLLPSAGAQDLTPPEAVQQTLHEWVQAKKTLAAERAEWAAEKQRLLDLNEIRRAELAQLDTLLTNLTSQASNAAARRTALVTNETQLLRERAVLHQRVTSWEAALRPQLPRLPAPLRERLGDSLRRLESGTNLDTKRALQDRARDVLFVLSEASAFHHTVTVHPERRTIDGGVREVDVLYLGLSQAWYVDRSGKFSGSGQADDAGWQWTANNTIAPTVRKAIDMTRQQTSPELIALPFPARRAP